MTQDPWRRPHCDRPEPGPVFGVALNALPKAVKRLGREQALAELAATIADPPAHTSPRVLRRGRASG